MLGLIHEVYQFDRDIPVKVSYQNYSENNPHSRHHWHEDLELFYFTKGASFVTIDHESFRISSGSLAVLNTNRIHTILPAGSEAEGYSILISRAFCEKNNCSIDKDLIQALIKEKQTVKMLKQLIEEYESDRKYRPQQLKALTLQLVIHLLRNYSFPGDKFYFPDQSGAVEQVKKTVAYMATHFTEPITVDFLAEMTGYSKNYFCSIFKEITDYTVISYLNHLRLRNAEILLSSGNYDIAEVAALCGYANPTYFSKRYKRYFHTLPSETKKAAKKPPTASEK